MKYGICILIILCGVFPILLRGTRWVRTTSIIVLCGLVVFYIMGLQTSARLATVKECQEAKKTPSQEWMDGTYKTRRVIEDLHPIGILLFAALVALAATPVKEK